MFYVSVVPEGNALLESRPGLRRWMAAIGDRKSVKDTTPSL
jgi:hypothetical protein